MLAKEQYPRALPWWIAFFGLAYLAVLPMARTIALRNILLFILLLAAVWGLKQALAQRKNGDRLQWVRSAWPLWLWAAYLIVFPAFSTNPNVAWDNLLGQWGKGLMAMAAGAAMAWWVDQRRVGSVLALGLAAFAPVGIYLGMFLVKMLKTGAIPWAYLGIEEHHSYLGYAVAHTILLLTAAFLVVRGKIRVLLGVLVLLALVSMALTQSRAGLAFGLTAGFLVLAASLKMAGRRELWRMGLAAVSLVVLGAIAFTLATRTDARWQNIDDRLSAGMMGDAVQIECAGTDQIEPAIRARFGPGPETDHIISHVRDGDGARVVLLRAALELAGEHPWGLDGSRTAFQKRLREICPEPTYKMSHAHNGWLDTALAIGWPGVALFLLVLLYFFSLGWKNLIREEQINPWALILVATPAFWALRGLIDSCFRDHMLEMQGFLLAYAAVALARQRSPEATLTLATKRR